MNITRISESGQMTIGIDTPVVVPSNFTGLDETLFDVWYIPNSADSSAVTQNFTFNMTDFSPQLIQVDLFFSDPMYVSLDTSLFDEVVVRCYKTLFASTISHEKDFRDLHWDYNQTSPRDDYIELRHHIPPQVRSEAEAEALEVANAVLAASLIVTFVLPLAAQIALKGAMNKVWSSFNTLQLLTLLPLMTISFPANIAMVFKQVE